MENNAQKLKFSSGVLPFRKKGFEKKGMPTNLKLVGVMLWETFFRPKVLIQLYPLSLSLAYLD